MNRTRWLGRARTTEALAALVKARLLVRFVSPGRWQTPLLESRDGPVPTDIAIRHCSAALERAARRLPGTSRCLPLALAMRALLRRRGFESRLVIGIRPVERRQGEGDLHAWLEADAGMIFGDRGEADTPAFR